MGVTAVLLSAGYATRLYPLTKDRPKALLRLGEGVILDAVIASLGEVRDLRKRILVTNSRFAERFQEWQKARGAEIQILDDGTSTVETRLGAIRDLALARTMTDPADDLLVLGTDNLFRWSLGDFVQAAQRHQPDPSIALWNAPSTEAATQFGVVLRDKRSRITDFVEKSTVPPSTEVAVAVYYFPAAMCGRIQEFIDGGGNVDAPGYFLEWLVRRGAVFGIMMPGLWYDIGSLASYDTVVAEWQAQGTPTQKRRV